MQDVRVSASPITDRYRMFAEIEAHGVSALYEDWALGIADDTEAGALIAGLPLAKQQPNLVFASARRADVPLLPWFRARSDFISRWDTIEATALSRATQTNEAGRCATLLPAFAARQRPLALIEVGASAGFCLYPDRYSYLYRTLEGPVRLDPESGPSPVLLRCDFTGSPTPPYLPDVVWRAGVDLNPLDPTDPETIDWLETLVWPEHTERRERIRAAASIAASEPPILERGDLLDVLPSLVESAPADAEVVVFHSAVMPYMSADDRAAFRELVEDLPVTWVSNEGSMVFPDIERLLPQDADARGSFILAVDGSPIALTSPHGGYYRGLS